MTIIEQQAYEAVRTIARQTARIADAMEQMLEILKLKPPVSGCEHPVEASLAAGAMENPETESLKRGAARTGEYVGREGDCEIVEQPLTPRHAADASGGDLQRRNANDAKGKAPCVETRRGNAQSGGNTAHRITATASPHGKLNFVQEEIQI